MPANIEAAEAGCNGIVHRAGAAEDSIDVIICRVVMDYVSCKLRLPLLQVHDLRHRELRVHFGAGDRVNCLLPQPTCQSIRIFLTAAIHAEHGVRQRFSVCTDRDQRLTV